MANKKSQLQTNVERMLAYSGDKRTYSQWRTTTLHEVALKLVEGTGAEYEDAVLGVAANAMLATKFEELTHKVGANASGKPNGAPNAH